MHKAVQSLVFVMGIANPLEFRGLMWVSWRMDVEDVACLLHGVAGTVTIRNDSFKGDCFLAVGFN